ncbi:LADA_0H13080g1_1 [Lachancea dasiensis]|uniref:Copper transport protein n=1 Tax=Lachancea dasiensis TaxID=1072105 RepID=A0A1G4K434_9SACH|nr:LADA_0H13080g1_1 [Lachancea dasiensis]
MSSSAIIEPAVRMSMGMGNSSGGSAKTCKISMLWNWYTIDTCFISKSWMNDTRGKFAGSCIGCFLLVVAAQWLNRVSRQFDLELAKRRKFKTLVKHMGTLNIGDEGSVSSLPDSALQELQTLVSEPDWRTTLRALGSTLSHTWYVSHNLTDGSAEVESMTRCCSTPLNIYPTMLDHVLRALIFTIQWGLSYIIMLLFMYYNGYIIISCLLGALFGRLLFNFEPLTTCGGSNSSGNIVAHDKEENDRKCCM